MPPLAFVRHVLSVAVLATGLALPETAAQDRIIEFLPPTGVEFTGGAGIGDIDLDGFADYAIGDWFSVVTTYSGSTGAPLYTMTKPTAFRGWGYRQIPVPDLNQDGITDFVISGGSYSAHREPMFSVHDGSNGAVLWISSLLMPGYDRSLRPLDDIDGDAVVDFLMGGANSYGGAYAIMSGVNGTLIRTDYKPWDSGFGSVATADDVDGDGTIDYLVGHPSTNNVYLYSGSDASLLSTYSGSFPKGYYGQLVERMDDLDGDGSGDLAIGFWESAARRWAVDFVSGATGSVLATRTMPVEPDRVIELQSLGDVSGDGFRDLTISISQIGTPTRFEVVSGRTLNILYEFRLADSKAVITQIRPASDVDGDGLADVVLCHAEEKMGTLRSYFAIYGGNDLWLEISPNAPKANAAVDVKLAEGSVSESTVIAIVEVNGAPTFLPIELFEPFESSGLWTGSFVVPPGLSGAWIRLRGYSFGAGVTRVSGTEPVFFL